MAAVPPASRPTSVPISARRRSPAVPVRASRLAVAAVGGAAVGSHDEEDAAHRFGARAIVVAAGVGLPVIAGLPTAIVGSSSSRTKRRGATPVIGGSARSAAATSAAPSGRSPGSLASILSTSA